MKQQLDFAAAADFDMNAKQFWALRFAKATHRFYAAF